jgi:hypothetical protein
MLTRGQAAQSKGIKLSQRSPVPLVNNISNTTINNISTDTILSGAGLPTDDIGSDGDFYVDTGTNLTYGPKTEGVWNIPT